MIVSVAAGEGPRLRLQKAAPLISVGKVPEREIACSEKRPGVGDKGAPSGGARTPPQSVP